MEYKDLNIAVVLPAGGIGERIGIKPLKQFFPIEGKPLMCYSIEAFERLSWIKRIVVVVAIDKLDQTTEICKKYQKVNLVVGGYSRHRSIAAGVKYLENEQPNLVIIHDAVRPLVPLDVLDRVLYAAHKHKAAGPVGPLTSTVVSKDENGFLKTSLTRGEYSNSEMPQAFNYSTILEAYNKCSDYDLDFGTECLHLVDKYCCIKPMLVEGSPDLWKVTYIRDLHIAKALLKNEPVCYLHFGTLIENVSEKIKTKLKLQGVKLCNEIKESNNCIIFHSNCNLLDNLTCCVSEVYELQVPEIVINILCNDSVDHNYEELFQFSNTFSKKFEMTNKMCFTIWLRTKDWSDETLLNLINLVVDLLNMNNHNFCNQLFIV